MISDHILKEIFEEKSWITSDSIWNEVASKKILKIKVDFLFKGGIWRNNYIEAAWKSCLKNPEIKHLLVSHGDREFKKSFYTFFSALGIKNIYATNVAARIQNSRINALPLGLTNNTNESPLHPILGNQNIFKDILKIKKTNNTHLKVYVNINLNTYYSRKKLLSTIKNLSHISVDIPEYSPKGRFSFLSKIRNSDYVICPRGNGIDTHRFWETLYAGSIPIVTSKDLPIVGLQEKLPILILDSWQDVSNSKLLSERLMYFKSLEYDAEILKRKYWVDLVKKFE
jgi:hypothetical protein